MDILFALVLITYRYNGGTAMVVVDPVGWKTIEECQRAGEIVRKQNPQVAYVCAPKRT